jgi:hypothetical protein
MIRKKQRDFLKTICQSELIWFKAHRFKVTSSIFSKFLQKSSNVANLLDPEPFSSDFDKRSSIEKAIQFFFANHYFPLDFGSIQLSLGFHLALTA